MSKFWGHVANGIVYLVVGVAAVAAAWFIIKLQFTGAF